jgi:hypothetical protein
MQSKGYDPMTTPNFTTSTTLPPLLTQQERVARLCYDCGALGKVYGGNTLYCVTCWLARYEGARAC